MGGTKNINKKLRIAIFTALFLIGSIYSVYSQATSTQNNAVSSLESNSIIQEIISSASSGYSTAGQYLANFLSINGIPSYVWTIITFLMTTLLFVAIYTFLFEIFMQKANITQNETIRKSKILFIFALSVFSAIAIGYAIPFLLNLYGLILLILVLIALFFFGRAAISYGKGFHYAAKSFAADIEKEFLEVEKELKEARKDLSEQDIKYLEEGREKVHNELEKINNEFNDAETEFKNILSSLVQLYRRFLSRLVRDYYSYYNDPSQPGYNFQPNQKNELDDFIKYLQNIRRKLHPDMQLIPSIRKLYDDILRRIQGLKSIDETYKTELRYILDRAYRNIILQSQISSTIQNTINKYRKVETLLINFNGFEDGFKRDIPVRLRHFFNDPDNRKYEMGILSALNKSKNYIREIKNLVNRRIQFLENLLH